MNQLQQRSLIADVNGVTVGFDDRLVIDIKDYRHTMRNENMHRNL